MRNVPASLALAVLASACARAYPPPGGEQDTTPPGLASVTPEALAVLPNYDGPVVFRFNERLSERGFAESLVVVSPLDGALRVDRGRREVRVSIDGGWRPNRVYRVIVEPGLRDMFGNARTEAAELVFSTGPPVPNTAIAGIVGDKLSGRGADAAVVTAVRRADTVSYMALADSSGFYALRHLPLGVYDLRAYSDQNRNRRRDFAEAVDSGRSVSLGSPTDTITEIFTLLQPDTTGPRDIDAEAVDSLHVRVTFDDYIEPVDSLIRIQGRVVSLPDSAEYALVVGALHPTAWERQQPVAVDTTTPDTLPARPPQRRPPARVDEPLLPNRDLIVRLDRPLRPGRFVITVTNAVNINGLTGGGSDDFQVREPPPPVRRDTVTNRTDVYVHVHEYVYVDGGGDGVTWLDTARRSSIDLQMRARSTARPDPIAPSPSPSPTPSPFVSLSPFR